MRVKHETLMKAAFSMLLILALIDTGFIIDYHLHVRTFQKACEASRYLRWEENYIYQPNGSYHAHVSIKNYKDAERFVEAFRAYRPLVAPGTSKCDEKGGVLLLFIESNRYKEFVEKAGGHILWPIETPEEIKRMVQRPILNRTGNMTYLRFEYNVYASTDYYHFAMSLIEANTLVIILTLVIVSRKYGIKELLWV